MVSGRKLERGLLMSALMKNMKSFVTALALIFAIGITACSSMEVNTQKDPQADLAKYKTFAWAPTQHSAGNSPNASILEETVKAEVEKQLFAKGLQKAEGTEPDLLIAYSARAQQDVAYGAAP